MATNIFILAAATIFIILAMVIIYQLGENRRLRDAREEDFRRDMRKRLAAIERANLTKTEKEVLIDLADPDMTVKDIADKRFKSEETIKVHKRNIYRKLDIHNNKQVIIYAQDYAKGQQDDTRNN